MARVLITSAYNDLEDWPGRLFEADDDTIINTRDSGLFVWTHGGSSDFPDFSVRVSGSGFTYEDGTPTGGTISRIEIRDASNNLVLTIKDFSGNGPERDLAQIFSDMFGWNQGDDGVGPNGKMAWSHILIGNDTIVGTNGNDQRDLPGYMGGNDRFDMKGGDDYVACGAGKDTVNGGSGYDVLSYASSSYNEGIAAFQGLNVNVAAGTAIDCWGFKDTFSSIEAIEGSRFNDLFKGSSGENTFSGLRGRDTLNGGGGSDFIDYQNDIWNGGNRGITLDLETSFKNGVATGRATDGFGQRDTIINVENVGGTEFDDRIIGSRLSNWMTGRDGDDTLTGGGGRDQFNWYTQDHLGDDDVITDFAANGPSRDTLLFKTDNFNNMTTNLTLVIDSAPTTTDGTFIFDSSNDTLYWDEDGTGGVGAIKIVQLNGVNSLSAANFDLF
jgi:serralysin